MDYVSILVKLLTILVYLFVEQEDSLAIMGAYYS